jgi:hypothetical protein
MDSKHIQLRLDKPMDSEETVPTRFNRIVTIGEALDKVITTMKDKKMNFDDAMEFARRKTQRGVTLPVNADFVWEQNRLIEKLYEHIKSLSLPVVTIGDAATDNIPVKIMWRAGLAYNDGGLCRKCRKYKYVAPEGQLCQCDKQQESK